ncbi:MAG: nuclear transport factor 2 family protein [Thermoleophilaceae bacterium]|nr:nuclear transport factor 2 family protein [Thermoleophilaceae bacterium]
MPQTNAELIERFYAAFARRDGQAMTDCYALGATFADPVFTDLVNAEPGAMWRMLTSRADDLEIQLVEHDAGEETGTARWLADYTFSQTGRKVHNDVRASFRFRDGKILEHRDAFSFHRWARQALGPAGLALGWTPVLRAATRRKARAGLDEFIANEDRSKA